MSDDDVVKRVSVSGIVSVLEQGESVVSMIEYQGRVWVATSWHVYRLGDDGKLHEVIFVPHASAAEQEMA